MTTVTFTADTGKSGTLAKIVLAMTQLGIKPVGQSMSKPNGEDCSLITFELDAAQSLTAEELEGIKLVVPSVTKIETSAPVFAPSARDVRTKTAPLLKDLGQRLIAAYPDITAEIRSIERDLSDFDPSVRDDLLPQLGKGLGKWQYQKNYSLGARLPLDKTLQRIVWPALERLFEITKEPWQVSVTDCPHCTTGRQSSQLDCHFVAGYIRGLLESISKLSPPSVEQTKSKASGGNACVFEIHQN